MTSLTHDSTIEQDALALVLAATQFAALKHRDQRRKDAEASPYINHPIALANVLRLEGDVTDAIVLAAALLHDTLEDTETTFDELVAHFGGDVAAVVMEVTDDKSLPKTQRKQLQIDHASHSSPRAKLVKLADKICNLRDLLASPPKDWPIERIEAYFDWAQKVAVGLRGNNSHLEAILDTLLAQKPTP